MKKITILIPAYNESKTILEILRRVQQQKIDGIELEVLVIDDGSKDNTVQLLEENPGLYTKLIKQPVNGGKGAAVKAGLGAASGDYILFQDADLEYDPADYAKLFEPILRFDADIVMGSRMIASQITRVSYFWHKVGNRLITVIFNIMNNTTFTDVYSCYLLYRRSLFKPERLVTMGWEQHDEIPTYAVGNAKAIYEVPVNYYGRSYEEGKKIRAHHSIPVIWAMISKISAVKVRKDRTLGVAR